MTDYTLARRVPVPQAPLFDVRKWLLNVELRLRLHPVDEKVPAALRTFIRMRIP